MVTNGNLSVNTSVEVSVASNETSRNSIISDSESDKVIFDYFSILKNSKIGFLFFIINPKLELVY